MEQELRFLLKQLEEKQDDIINFINGNDLDSDQMFMQNTRVDDIDFVIRRLAGILEHKELTLTLDNGEIKPAADGK